MRLLDLFCCQGGASMGYYRAGFNEIVGVDLVPQPRYPFDFVQADALEFLAGHGSEFDLIHASPPCQDHSKYRRTRWTEPSGTGWLVSATRETLREVGRAYVIENVPGAPMEDPVLLCGSMFGLKVRRHRLFESNVPLAAPASCDHKAQGLVVTVTGHTGGVSTRDGLLGRGTLDSWKSAMDVRWMTASGLSQAIPPAFTQELGRQLLATVGLACV